MNTQADLLIYGASQLVTCAGPAPLRGPALSELSIIPDGAVAIRDGRFIAVGPSADLRERFAAAEFIDAAGCVICPGFVDCHTHLLYAGDRAAEFEMRIGGAAYMDILQAGGGILSTMHAVRAAGPDQLAAESRDRLDAMLALGTTTAEVKTGYGLSLAAELDMLHAIAALDATHPVELVPTFLAAHAVPPEYQDRPDDYLTHIINDMLPAALDWYRSSHFAAEGLPFFVDVFCEQGVFDLAQSRRMLQAAAALGLPLKAHVDEFVSLGGAALAAELGAVSADHLDVTPPEDIARLAASETVAVLLPAVNFNFGSSHYAPARALVDAGAAVALATDINPGSAPCPSLPLVMAIACRYQRLLPAEALNACTINAACALGLQDRLGSIETGKQADLLILNMADYRHLAYEFGANPVLQVVKKGVIV